mmetsp:Transcript_50973/g.95396  ORF Transcript_50973/g.95396 Transcript_50973/m.95396 type:complete len:265 (-) Transcript_50973:87-881(-)
MEGINFVERELEDANNKFQEAQSRRGMALQSVEKHEAAFNEDQARWTIRQEREYRRDQAARRLQRWWSRAGTRGATVFPLFAMLEKHRLLRARAELEENLLGLRRCVHDLHVVDVDREHASVKIQRWWRRTLAKRIMKIISMYGKVSKIKRLVEMAAARIQALVRGNAARREAQELRESKRAAEEENERRMEQIKMQAVVSIQNTYRKSVAVKQVQLLRARMFAAVMSQGISDSDMMAHRQKLQPLRSQWLKGGSAKATPKKKR